MTLALHPEQSAEISISPRDERQAAVAAWVAAAFVINQVNDVHQTAVRLLEEAIELYQAAGGHPDMAMDLVDYIFHRPVGELKRELGGLGITLLAMAEAAGVSADECEKAEFARVLSKPLEHFKKRNEEKNAAGFEVVS